MNFIKISYTNHIARSQILREQYAESSKLMTIYFSRQVVFMWVCVL